MSSPSPQSNQKPDLDDSINVTKTHGRVELESAATLRERRIADNDHEPVALWVIVACGIVLLIAGAVLGNAGNFSLTMTLFALNMSVMKFQVVPQKVQLLS